jgi:hypothetical protein
MPKRPTPLDLAWRQVALDEKEGRLPEFVAETETEKRMEALAERARESRQELRRIRQLNRDGNDDAYLAAIGEYLRRHTSSTAASTAPSGGPSDDDDSSSDDESSSGDDKYPGHGGGGDDDDKDSDDDESLDNDKDETDAERDTMAMMAAAATILLHTTLMHPWMLMQ